MTTQRLKVSGWPGNRDLSLRERDTEKYRYVEMFLFLGTYLVISTSGNTKYMFEQADHVL
jgi:hypothetical protein